MATQTTKRISRTMTIEEILTSFPSKAQKLAQELTNTGLQCVGCGAATWETLEAGVLAHERSEEEIDQLEERLNQILEEEVDLSTITLTARAAQKYLSILEEDGRLGWGLRLSEVPAGCSGFEYLLDYSEKSTPDDEVFESQGIEIHVSKKLLARMIGTEIDYVDGLNGSGFKISNPNVRSSCGCGTSHGY
jgi:iron-sulfur cluster assembly accessory protein